MSDNKTSGREPASSSIPEDTQARQRKPVAKRPEEIEPLDEKVLEQVMRDCPL